MQHANTFQITIYTFFIVTSVHFEHQISIEQVNYPTIIYLYIKIKKDPTIT